MSGVESEDRDDFMQANIDDLNAALSHLGFDNMEDFHQWALDENELKRFDQLCLLLTRHRQAAYAAGRDAERGRAANVGYAVCASTRHVTLGDKVRAVIQSGQPVSSSIAAATEGGA